MSIVSDLLEVSSQMIQKSRHLQRVILLPALDTDVRVDLSLSDNANSSPLSLERNCDDCRLKLMTFRCSKLSDKNPALD